MRLNLQANVLTLWVLPVLCRFFLTNWWCGWLIDDQFRLSLPIMTEWIQGQPGWIVKLADWVSHQLTDWLIDWLSGELANWEIDSWFRACWKAYWPIHCLNVFIGSIFLWKIKTKTKDALAACTVWGIFFWPHWLNNLVLTDWQSLRLDDLTPQLTDCMSLLCGVWQPDLLTERFTVDFLTVYDVLTMSVTHIKKAEWLSNCLGLTRWLNDVELTCGLF